MHSLIADNHQRFVSLFIMIWSTIILCNDDLEQLNCLQFSPNLCRIAFIFIAQINGIILDYRKIQFYVVIVSALCNVCKCKPSHRFSLSIVIIYFLVHDLRSELPPVIEIWIHNTFFTRRRGAMICGNGCFSVEEVYRVKTFIGKYFLRNENISIDSKSKEFRATPWSKPMSYKIMRIPTT